MRSERFIAAVLGGIVWVGVGAAAPPEPVEAALLESDMLDVLEAHLLGRLDRVSDEAERADLIERLAVLYAYLPRATPETDPQRTMLVDRAWALADRAGESAAVELRLLLLLDAYLPIERAAELHELGLLPEAERTGLAEELGPIRVRLDAMARDAVVRAAAAERRAGVSDDPAAFDAATEAYRQRSLTNYYAAWSGLTLAVLEGVTPSPDVLRSFGWLVGAAGELPTLDDLGGSALELEHVARAAVGVGRTRALAGESLLAEQWLRRVADSDETPPPVKAQARARLLRLEADEGDWTGVIQTARGVQEMDPDGWLPTPEARYVAIRAMQALDRGRTESGAEAAARLALTDLVARGEIGHVLDLRERFGARGLLGVGFIAQYADGLDRLDEAQAAGTPGLFGDAARRLWDAAEAEDAGRFPLQRDDALLKAAFAEIRAGNPRAAAELAQRVLDGTPAERAAEEALWLLIVALDETGDDRVRDRLGSAVRDYLARYPGTQRASKLLVRHAGSDLLEPEAVAEGLRGMDESDPLVLSARRVLARLIYRGWVQGGRADAAVRAELLDLIDWIWARADAGPDPGTPRDRLDVARIAIDAAMGAEPQRSAIAERALARARAAVRADSSLARFSDDLSLRAAEILATTGRLEEAALEAERLRQAASDLAPAAERAVLAGVFRRLEADPGDEAAAELGVRLGTKVAADLIPPAPQRLSPEASRLLDRIWRLAAMRAEVAGDPALESLALRLAGVVLERGSPTAQGLRELAELADRTGDHATELQAWATLLAASRDDEPAWWEARYHTLRLMLQRDSDAARAAYEQHRVLHPLPGLLPWTRMIDELFPPNAEPEIAP